MSSKVANFARLFGLYSNVFKSNDKIFLFKGQDMIHLDLDNGVQKGLNMTGLDAFIKDISFVAGKVIVGTDAGVYYKSWESFLNK